MSKHISEGQVGPRRGHAAGETDMEKQASQLASDTKYKVKQRLGKHTNLNPAQVAKEYLKQLAKSPAPGGVKALAKKKLMGGTSSGPSVSKEEYIGDIGNVVQESLVDALTKVFVEGVEKEEENSSDYLEEFYSRVNKSGERIYHIKVTDKKTGNTYTRDATREKIAELRANPNISSVEMSEYDKDSEEEKTSGSNTASVKAGKGLAKKDYDGDGKTESPAKEYRGVVHNAIQKRRGGTPDGKDTSSVKEEFIGEVKVKKSDDEKITGDGVNNYKGKDAVVKLFPEVSEQVNPDQEQQNPQQQKSDAEKRRQLSTLQQFQRKKDQLNRQKIAAQKANKIPVGSVQMNSFEPEGDSLDEKITAKTDMGDAIRDFYASKSPQLAGRTKEERRKAAIAAVLTARRGGRKLGEETKSETDEVDEREMPTKATLLKNKLRARGIQVASLTPSPRNMKTSDDLDEAKAVGSVRSGDENPKGAEVRVSSGRGMTMTPAKGLGASKPSGDDAERRAKYNAQVKADRRAAAKDRAAEGDDRIGRLIRSVQKNSFELEGEQIQEKDEKVEAEFKRARTPHLLSQFRQKHPGSRQSPKVPGAKETESEKQRRLTNRQVARAVKHGLTKKERGESEARARYDTPRD